MIATQTTNKQIAGSRLLAGVVLGLALAARLWNFGWGLPLLLHPDEWSQVDVAWRIAGGDPNPHFFRYSTAYMYALAPILKVADWVIGPLGQPDRYAVARVIAALVGTITVWLVWRWARLVVPERWALAAAALLALNPAHVIHSHYATIDVPLALAVCASGYALTRLAQSAPAERRRWVFGAAVCVGLAIGVKYTAILLLIPLVAVVVAGAPAPSRPRGRAGRATLIALGALLVAGALIYRLALPQVVAFAAGLTTDGHLEREYLSFLSLVFWGLALGGVAVVGLAVPRWERWTARLLEPALLQGLAIVVAVFVCSSPFVLIDYRHSLVDIFYEYRHASIGAAAHVPEGTAGITQPTLADNAGVYLRQLWGDFGLLLPLAGAGLLYIAACQRRLFAPIALLPLLVLVVALRAGNVADRYLLPAYPAICLVGISGLYGIARRLPRQRAWAGAGAAAAIAVCALALAARMTAFALPDTRSLAYDWIAAHIPAGSRVANENYTQTPNLASLPLTQLMADRGFDLAVRWEGRADYLLVGETGAATPAAIDALRQRYGSAVLVITADQRSAQGATQYLFRLTPARAAHTAPSPLNNESPQ